MTDPRFPVAILGEALIDRFPDGDVVGGAPFNVARNLAALGARPLMITRIGRDAPGAAIEAEFRAFGLDPAGLQHDAARPTGTVAVRMVGRTHAFEIGADAAWDRLDPAATSAAVRAAMPAVVYFGTLAQRSPASRDAIAAAIAAALAAPTPATVFLDLNLRGGADDRRLAETSLLRATELKVNDDELDRLVGWFEPEAVVPSAVSAWDAGAHRAVVASLARRFGLRRVAVTRGAAGWAAYEADGDGWREGAAAPVEVRDTVGAGDAFAAVLLLGGLRGWPWPTTLARAAAHASRVCGLQGAVDPSGRVYAEALDAWAAEDVTR